MKGVEGVQPDDQKKIVDMWKLLGEGGANATGEGGAATGPGKRKAAEDADALRQAMEPQGVLTDAQFAALKMEKQDLV